VNTAALNTVPLNGRTVPGEVVADTPQPAGAFGPRLAALHERGAVTIELVPRTTHRRISAPVPIQVIRELFDL